MLELVAQKGDAASLAALMKEYYPTSEAAPIEWQAILAVQSGDDAAVQRIVTQLRASDNGFTVPLPVDYVMRLTNNSKHARAFVTLLTEPGRAPDVRALGNQLLGQIGKSPTI